MFFQCPDDTSMDKKKMVLKKVLSKYDGKWGMIGAYNPYAKPSFEWPSYVETPPSIPGGRNSDNSSKIWQKTTKKTL